MPKFIPYDYNQSAMLVINYLDQLQPGTFEHAIHYLIDNKLDLSIFDNKYQNEDNGRPAYAPAVLLKIILFATPKASHPAARYSGAANQRGQVLPRAPLIGLLFVKFSGFFPQTDRC